MRRTTTWDIDIADTLGLATGDQVEIGLPNDRTIISEIQHVVLNEYGVVAILLTSGALIPWNAIQYILTKEKDQ